MVCPPVKFLSSCISQWLASKSILKWFQVGLFHAKPLKKSSFNQLPGLWMMHKLFRLLPISCRILVESGQKFMMPWFCLLSFKKWLGYIYIWFPFNKGLLCYMWNLGLIHLHNKLPRLFMTFYFFKISFDFINNMYLSKSIC